MPLIVDKEAVRMDILMAFQRCIDRKPLTNVSLRDIAAEAKMSHAKLLNYFDSKEELLISYVRYWIARKPLIVISSIVGSF